MINATRHVWMYNAQSAKYIARLTFGVVEWGGRLPLKTQSLDEEFFLSPNCERVASLWSKTPYLDKIYFISIKLFSVAVAAMTDQLAPVENMNTRMPTNLITIICFVLFRGCFLVTLVARKWRWWLNHWGEARDWGTMPQWEISTWGCPMSCSPSFASSSPLTTWRMPCWSAGMLDIKNTVWKIQ